MLKRIHSFVRALGLKTGLKWAWYKYRTNRGIAVPRVVSFRPRGINHPLIVRGRPCSDEAVADQIFLEQEYLCLIDLRPATILDLGANVGYSSVWFANHFPGTRILAVEPDPLNYQMLLRNCSLYPSIRTVLGAVWSESCVLELVRGRFRDGADWATQVQSRPTGNVAGFAIPELLKLAGFDCVDLLKIDIERAELELFASGTDAWLPLVRNICIELHDSDCERVFFSAMRDYDYDLGRSGELTICRNVSYKITPH